MANHWDEFSKSLAEDPLPRRQSLRLLGAAFVGAFFSPLALTASAAGQDRCKTFCNQVPKATRSRCITACRACSNDPSRLCTDGWSYDCCGGGESCCGSTCRDLTADFDHCGACDNDCEEPGPYENGACVDGRCEYWCVEGAAVCDGRCSRLESDPENCGACGNVCPASAPACIGGICSECPAGYTNCGGYCADLAYDSYNCGACGFACPGTPCVEGQCDFGSPPSDW